MNQAKIYYDDLKNHVDERIAKIISLLESHHKEASENGCSWGYAGDLAHIDMQLGEIENFLINDD